MKRSEEERIMIRAVATVGFPISEELSKALCEGLKQIRCAKHQENRERKLRFAEQQKNHPGRHYRRKKKSKPSLPEANPSELP